MRRLQKFFWFSSLTVFLIPTLGCASTRSLRYPDAPQGQVFLAPAPRFDGAAFMEKWAGSEGESAKIRYLLDRIAGSRDTFIRNGNTHDGRTARRWLLYKLTHWVSGVQTAQDFVTRVASFSQKTGEPYLVRTQDGKIYSLESVLRNELSALETAVVQFRTLPQGGTLPQPVSVSLVPTSAIATSTN